MKSLGYSYLTYSLNSSAPILPLHYHSFGTSFNTKSILIFYNNFSQLWKVWMKMRFSKYCEKFLCKKISHLVLPEFESTQQSRFLDFNAYKMRIKADEFQHSNILIMNMKVTRIYLKLILFCLNILHQFFTCQYDCQMREKAKQVSIVLTINLMQIWICSKPHKCSIKP